MRLLLWVLPLSSSLVEAAQAWKGRRRLLEGGRLAILLLVDGLAAGRWVAVPRGRRVAGGGIVMRHGRRIAHGVLLLGHRRAAIVMRRLLGMLAGRASGLRRVRVVGHGRRRQWRGSGWGRRAALRRGERRWW